MAAKPATRASSSYRNVERHKRRAPAESKRNRRRDLIVGKRGLSQARESRDLLGNRRQAIVRDVESLELHQATDLGTQLFESDRFQRQMTQSRDGEEVVGRRQ